MDKHKLWKKFRLFCLMAVGLSLTVIGCGKSGTQTGGENMENQEQASSGENIDNQEQVPSGKDVVLRFVAMSDVHIGAVGDTDYYRFGQAMGTAYEYAQSQAYTNLDAVIVAGDMTNYGYEYEILAFKKALEAYVNKETKPLLIMGNHEYFVEAGDHVIERWERVLECDMNTHEIINGYHFINLSLSDYSNYEPSLDWLKEELAKAAADDPKKPIFVQNHYPVTNTVYGSDLWGTNQLTEILNQYPQIIDFSGHSHYPINDPRSIWQGTFTALGCGTMSYYELEPGMIYGTIPPNADKACQYYMVEVHADNSVNIKMYDVLTKQFFAAEYDIETPSDPSTFVYTDERRNSADAPVFPAGAQITVEEVGDTSVKLTIPQAADGECIHSYRFEFYRNGILDTTGSIWSEFYFMDMPDTLTQEFTGLLEGSYYTVKVTALDSWGKECEVPLSADFETTGEVPESANPGEEIPTADVLDIRVESSGITDVSAKNKTVENEGANIVFSENAGRYVADFDGVSTSLAIRYAVDEMESISREFSMELGFILDNFPSSFSDPFACMQQGGYGFEINAAAKKLEFWCSINGAYQIVSAPIETGKYYNAVASYNGRELVLYLDGVAVDSVIGAGTVSYPTSAAAHAYRVGADITGDGGAEGLFDGRISHARVYSYAVTPQQVKNLFEKEK